VSVRQILQGIIRRPNGDVALRNNPRVSVTFVEIVASLVKIAQEPSKQSPVVKFYIGDSSTPETLPAEYWVRFCSPNRIIALRSPLIMVTSLDLGGNDK
jgi:hypothetical protein